MLSIDNLSRKIGGRTILKNVSLDVKKAEVFAVLGYSGSGKSTLLRAIAGLDRPDGGSIKIDGKYVYSGNINMPSKNRGVAMMFQNYALLPHMDVLQNITLGFSGKDGYADYVLQKMRMSKLSKRYPHELSGGQQQRVALARALVRSPKVLLLDEPFSSVDARLKKELRSELLEVIREFSTTVVLVTHDKEDVYFMADRAAILGDKSIIQTGTPKELYESPLNGYCAEFLGSANMLDSGAGTAFGLEIGDRPLCIRPQAVKLDEVYPHKGCVREAVYCGGYYEYTIEKDGVRLLCRSDKNTKSGSRSA